MLNNSDQFFIPIIYPSTKQEPQSCIVYTRQSCIVYTRQSCIVYTRQSCTLDNRVLCTLDNRVHQTIVYCVQWTIVYCVHQTILYCVHQQTRNVGRGITITIQKAFDGKRSMCIIIYFNRPEHRYLCLYIHAQI